VRVPRVTVRSAFVAVAVVVAVLQLTAVTLAALPPNRYSEAADPQLAYLDPYFTQNWRLFAPDPVAEDRSVLFQGSYRAGDGTTKQTAIVDWTAVELDLIHHRLVGGRAGYITNKLIGPLELRFRRLSSVQQAVANGTTAETPPTWSALARDLRSAEGNPLVVPAYLRYEQATTRLATDVLEGRWPDRQLVAVRYVVRKRPVVPYANRTGSSAERAATRPAASERRSGWRTPTPGDAAERKAVADFDRRHR
jgi:hypothetical protein